MGFLQWWRDRLVILMCSFSILKIPHCPPMFIWMTFVQLQHPAGLLTAARYGGDGCQEAGHATHAGTTFYRLSYKLLMYLVCLSENTFFAPKRCADTQQRCPFLPCLHPKHTTSSSPTSSLTPSWLIYILIQRKRNLLWWQCSHFFTLRTISPCLKFTEAQQVVSYPTKHLIYYTTEFL